MNVDKFAHQIEAICNSLWDSFAALMAIENQTTNELFLPTEKIRAQIFQELCAALKDIKIPETELYQQNQDLIAARQAIEAERQRYQDLFEFAPDGYLVTDAAGKIQEANCAAAILLRISQQSLVGRHLASFVPVPERKAFHTQLAQLQKVGPVREWELLLMPRQGVPFDAAVRVAAVRNQTRQLVSLRWLVRDITERKQAEATIQYQAFHDLLTGLHNRTWFNEQQILALEKARSNQHMSAIMFLDLDRFKTINDTLGHTVGDLLLQRVAERLSSCIREGDTIARWGGDEFTILLNQINCQEDITQIAQRTVDCLKPAFYIEGHELYITTSIGIALYPYDGEDAQTLLRNADAALYRAKEYGRNHYQLYTTAMNSQASELLVLENMMHRALEREEFVLHYQPQVNVSTGKIGGLEALLRWKQPKLGLVLPGQFIPLAEENGLIVPIGEWVLRTACAQNKAWQDAGFPPVRVAVNLSARQFQQSNLVELVTQVLSETGLAPEFLELEITETTIIQNPNFAREILHDLQAMGVQISMDDFGTGYSSMSNLKKFPFHTLKIDQSFVQELISDPYDTAIIAAVIALGHGLNLRVLAEGVETQEQLDLLRSLQCDEMQGYLFSQPLRAEDIVQVLVQNHNRIENKIIGYCNSPKFYI